MISYLKSKLLPNAGLMGLFDCDCACAAAPNYEPVAAASKEAAQISADLGREQLAETRRQYNNNVAISAPVVQAQLALMQQNKQQGDDYYNYLVSRQRPVEDALNREALNTNNGIDNTERANMMARINSNAAADEATRQSIMGRVNSNAAADEATRQSIMGRVNSNAAADEAERNIITGGQRAIYNARKNDIEYQVGNAVADARAGATSSNNTAIRQALRYGMSAAQIAKALGTSSLTSAQQVVAAGNNARNLAIDSAKVDLSNAYNMRNQTNSQVISGLQSDSAMRNQTNSQVISGLQSDSAMRNQTNSQVISGLQSDSAMRNQTNNNILSGMQADRSMRLQTDSNQWAKKLDVAGLYRGLAGASQGAYSTSINAGNSAVSNQNSTAAQYLNGLNAGTNTIQQGLGMQLSGLGNVLNSQTSFANSQNQMYSSMAGSGDSFGSIAGGLGGLAMGAAKVAPLFMTSDRRLKDNIVLVGKDESGRFNLYEFTYIGSPDQKFIGVMADEVEPLVPDAVIYDDLGFASVNYDMIGVPFKEIKNAA